jgi:hypothetical protein
MFSWRKTTKCQKVGALVGPIDNVAPIGGYGSDFVPTSHAYECFALKEKKKREMT